MKRVLFGILIGLGLVLMCVAFIVKKYDAAEPMRHKVIRKKKYVRVRPSNI